MENPGKVRNARAPAGVPAADVGNGQVRPYKCSQGAKNTEPSYFCEVKRLCLSSLARWGVVGRGQGHLDWLSVHCLSPRVPQGVREAGGHRRASKSWKVSFIKY